jgi:Bardet-Biedl syndrome 7 protein
MFVLVGLEYLCTYIYSLQYVYILVLIAYITSAQGVTCDFYGHYSYISGVDLFISGKNVYNHFEDCKDTDYFLCSDRINDVLCLPPERTEGLSPVLACQDCALRLLHGSELVYEVEVAGPPKCTTLYGAGQSEGEDVLYGTQNGRIGLVQLGSEEPVYHWDIDNERREGGVTCLAVHDVLLDGVPDVLVGRDDGIVQLYSFDESEEPVLKFSHSFPESISSVAGGYVGSADHKEIVVGTYNGQIVGMTSRTSLHQAEIISSETRTKIAALK